MYVLATAGHVDHGKSTLVRALTGMEPDRWAEERRRGMTIDLGFAWTDLPTGEVLGFVDVPGHQRFLGNMLAGLGPAPAVLFVVAADGGWSRQSAEHLAAIDGLGLRHGLLAVTRSDLADPGPATRQALRAIAATSLGQVHAVAVSGTTGAGLDELRAAIGQVVRQFPAPDPHAPIRLWVDRVFTIHGAGTVVTGTLSSGTLTTGDTLQLGERQLTIRGLQSLGAPHRSVAATARVAVNLRGVDRDQVSRGDVLLSGPWHHTECVDVRLQHPTSQRQLVLHVGTAALPVRVRALGGNLARLQLPHALPLRVGDRALLRDPAAQQVITGVVILDTDPPALLRRGAAARRAAELSTAPELPNLQVELQRHGALRTDQLAARGIRAISVVPEIEGWAVEPQTWQRWIAELTQAVDRHTSEHPLDVGLPDETACQLLALAPALLASLVADAGLRRQRGRIQRPDAAVDLGPAESAVQQIERRLHQDPFDAPDAKELVALGLTKRHLAASHHAGRLLVLDGIALLPDAAELAVQRLTQCPEPFSVADARHALHSKRDVAVAVLEHLDAEGRTKRLPGGVRRLVSAPRAGSTPSS